MVTTVITIGNGSMDLYGQRLSQRLSTSSVHLSFPEPFGAGFFSLRALRFLFHSSKVLKTLGSHRILHLTNHHLARFVVFLKKSICILTVHDLIRQFDRMGISTYIHRPNLRDRLDLWLDWRGIKRAYHIIAPSQSTKKDLLKHTGIPEERISVIYHGIDHEIFYPRRGARPFPFPYILFVGSEHPRKNLVALLRAFHQLKQDTRFKHLKLVKAGKAGGEEDDFRARTLGLVRSLGLNEEVVFTGFVSEEELTNLYSHAECLVFPSLYEGFGWPPLEAMACGCPVITSNTSSLPEIVGEAGIMVNPHDISALVNALSAVLTDPELREWLRRKGLNRASMFTWEKAARETLAVYNLVEEALAKKRDFSWKIAIN
jgi:glycosyltransferase involved in cell wall biosynthesis